MLPESVQAIEIDETRCDGCGLCVDFCPVKVFSKESRDVKATKVEACYACDTCIALCPRNAIRITKAQNSNE